MIIIADTSALIALSASGTLHLLEQLFGKLYVPQTVYAECIIKGKHQSEKLLEFLKDKVKEVELVNQLDLPSNLGEGETEAMLLYKTLKADYLLIDDNRARKVAKLNNISVVGSIGVLLFAKQEKLIEKISPYIKKLEDSSLYFSPQLLADAINLAGEK